MPKSHTCLQTNTSDNSVWFKSLANSGFKYGVNKYNTSYIETKKDKALELCILQCINELICVSLNIKEVSQP